MTASHSSTDARMYMNRTPSSELQLTASDAFFNHLKWPLLPLTAVRRTGSWLSFSNFLTDFPPFQIRGSRGFVEKIQIIFFQLIFPPSLAYVAAGGLRKKFKIISFLSAFPPSLAYVAAGGLREKFKFLKILFSKWFPPFAYVAAGGLRKKSKKIILTDFPLGQPGVFFN